MVQNGQIKQMMPVVEFMERMQSAGAVRACDDDVEEAVKEGY